MDVRVMFSTLVNSFRRLMPHSVYGDGRRLEVLAWAVIGLGHCRTVNFNQWGEGVMSQAQYLSSHCRRFQRWLHILYTGTNLTFSRLSKV
jgi:hypothetical protein